MSIIYNEAFVIVVCLALFFFLNGALWILGCYHLKMLHLVLRRYLESNWVVESCCHLVFVSVFVMLGLIIFISVLQAKRQIHTKIMVKK